MNDCMNDVLYGKLIKFELLSSNPIDGAIAGPVIDQQEYCGHSEVRCLGVAALGAWLQF